MNEQDPSQPLGPPESHPAPLPRVGLMFDGIPYAGTWTYEEEDGQVHIGFDPPLASFGSPSGIGRISLLLRPRDPADSPPAV